MGRIGIGELAVVLLILLLLFGATRLPGIARALGRSVSEFKKGRDEGTKSSDEGSADVKKDK